VFKDVQNNELLSSAAPSSGLISARFLKYGLAAPRDQDLQHPLTFQKSWKTKEFDQMFRSLLSNAMEYLDTCDAADEDSSNNNNGGYLWRILFKTGHHLQIALDMQDIRRARVEDFLVGVGKSWVKKT
jgi:hypothetical protein